LELQSTRMVAGSSRLSAQMIYRNGLTSDRFAYASIESEAVGPSLILGLNSIEPLSEGLFERLCDVGITYFARIIELLIRENTTDLAVRELEAIIDHISDGLIVLDRSGFVRYINAPGAKILGVNPAMSLGREFKNVIDFEPFITPIFETKKGHIDREVHVRTRNKEIHLLDTAVPIIDERGTVISIVNTFHETARARQLSNRMAGDRARYRFSDILGHSSKLAGAIEMARRAAHSDSTVLLYGESGTGKELFAQSIHNEGPRGSDPFVAVNCAAMPRDLIESELFGYSPGSFTGADKGGRLGRFELASDGTIFLDEISEMPLDVQAKLLRVLQERQVTRIGGASSIPINIRVIVAANRDLSEMVGKKTFREDLFYRLNVLRIEVPPLRSRQDDIGLLVEQSIQRTCTLLHRPLIRLGQTALEQLKDYHWPGNVRELQNIIERLVNVTDDGHVEEIPVGWLAHNQLEFGASTKWQREVLSLEEAERRAVFVAMEACKYNVTKAAKSLGVTRPTLYAKLKRHGIGSRL